MTLKKLVLGLTCLLATSTAFSQSAAGDAPTPLKAPVTGYEVTQVGPDYYTFRYTGTRNIFLVTNAGVIVTDPIEPAAARVLRDEIRKITPLPVKYVVYSHQHWDHVMGGQIFKDEGAEFISHEKCVAHFTDLPNADIVPPDRTFSGDRYDLTLGNRSLQLRYYGLNHGDCLIVMTPSHVNVPFIVDLGTAGGMPLPFMPDYSLHNWVRTLRELEAQSFENYVGGHGIPVAPKSRLTERRQYLEALMTETKRELDAGTPYERIPDIVAARLTARFKHLRSFDRLVRDNVNRTITYYGMGW
ncbi:MAG: MBL fold metallo-hydrolase [Steroidobacteraceae bacterium]